jgi:hypothetical protein
MERLLICSVIVFIFFGQITVAQNFGPNNQTQGNQNLGPNNQTQGNQKVGPNNQTQGNQKVGPNNQTQGQKLYACNQIRQQCEKAGYNKEECLSFTVMGQAPSGVTVSQEVLTKCRKFRKNKKERIEMQGQAKAKGKANNKANNQEKADPCAKIKSMCIANGRNVGSCMNPILQGQSVPGVNVDKDTIEACKNSGSK